MKSTFDTYVNRFFLEQEEPAYPFDMKKVFYVRQGEVGDFREALKKMIKSDPMPLATGARPAKKPLFQLASFAGKIADSRLFASLLQEYFNAHGEPIKPKELLRNAQVKANEISLGNLYHEINKYFGEYLEYRLPLTKAEMLADEPEEEEEEEPELTRAQKLGAFGKKAAMVIGRELLNTLK